MAPGLVDILPGERTPAEASRRYGTPGVPYRRYVAIRGQYVHGEQAPRMIFPCPLSVTTWSEHRDTIKSATP